ncbi:TPR repeat region-containing protein [Nocardiopsis nanhaiensis]
MSFDPKIPDSTPEEATEIADDFRSLIRRLTGSSGDLYSGFNTTSMDFSDILAEEIRNAGAVNHDHWGEAGLAFAVAAEAADQWSEDLTWYDEKIEALELRLSATPITKDTPEEAALYDSFVQGLQQEADEHWETLEGKAEDCSTLLKGGTSAETVAELVNNGRLGWLAHNFVGDRAPMPLDAEMGGSHGNTLRDALESGEINSNEYERALRDLEMLQERAEKAQQRGEELSEGEIAYLDALYEAMEGMEAPSGSGGSDGAVAIPDAIAENIDDDTAAETLLAALGAGAMALSNDKLGGGYEKLPDSIQQASLGPTWGDDTYTNSGDGDTRYGEDLANLAALLGNAPEDLEAGERLSLNMSLSMGTLLNDATVDPDSDITQTIIETAGEGAIGDLIEVATRNSDANHAILKQDIPESHHVDPDRVSDLANDSLLGLLAYQWNEDGRHSNGSAVTGLFDWIPDDSLEGDSAEQERAAEAMLGFFDFISIEENHDALLYTGNEVEVVAEDGSTWTYDNAGFGQFNGDITNSLADMYEAYIVSFAGNEGYNSEGIPDLDWERQDGIDAWNPDDNTLSLSPSERLLFLELVMTNDVSAGRAHVATDIFNTAMAVDAVEQGDPTEATRKAGTLASLVDGALQNEYVARNLGEEDQANREQNVADSTRSVLTKLVSDVPIVGTAVDLIGGHYSDEIANLVVAQNSSEEHGLTVGSREGMVNKMNAVVLETAMEEFNNGNSDNPLEEIGDLHFDGDGSNRTVEEILDDTGILSEDEDGNLHANKDAAFDSMAETEGTSVAELNWALSQAAQATETTWIPGSHDSGLTFTGNAADSFTGRETGKDNPYLNEDARAALDDQ